MQAKRNKLFAGLINQTFEGFFCLFDLLCFLGNLVDINVEPQYRQSGIIDYFVRKKKQKKEKLKSANAMLMFCCDLEKGGIRGMEMTYFQDLLNFKYSLTRELVNVDNLLQKKKKKEHPCL